MEDNMWVVNKAHKCGMDDGELLASWNSALREQPEREREKKQQHLLTIPTAAAAQQLRPTEAIKRRVIQSHF